MKRIIAWHVFFAVCIFGLPSFMHAEELVGRNPREAANMWLQLLDEQKYAESWVAASLVFKSSVPKEQWAVAMESMRSPFGKTISRRITSEEYTETLPGAPKGQYAVLRYETYFKKKEAAIETVTSKLTKEGIWKVSRYYLH